jgi:mRNA-degrading endonuclease toxin of MazEF toxin-antitoxin module
MPSVCAVNLHQINTVPKQQIGRRITILSDKRMEEIQAAILVALGIGET